PWTIRTACARSAPCWSSSACCRSRRRYELRSLDGAAHERGAGFAGAGAGMTFRGVDHVGVGVADMDAALGFYGRVGFDDVLFDYTGQVPGPDRRARVVMLANGGAPPGGAGGATPR